MVVRDKKINLLDLVDKEFLQEFQDNFAKTTGLACVILNEEGFITEPSNFCDFCLFMKGNKKIYSVCSKCDLEKREIGFKSKVPFTYTCHAGLTNFMVPIVVNNQTIALIVAGQTFTESPDENLYKQLAKDFELNEKKYLKKVESIKISSKEKIEAAKNLLFQVANSISNSAHQNYELQQRGKRDNFYKEIVETIRSTLDIKEVKKRIINTVGKALSADICLIAEYDKKNDTFIPIEYEYLSSKKIEGFKAVDPKQKFPNFLKEFKKGKKILFKDKKFFIDGEEHEFEVEAQTFGKYKHTDGCAVPLYYKNQFLGIVAVNYFTRKYEMSADEINLLENISDQIATALYQAQAYNELNDYAKKESLIRKIIESIRNTIDIEETKKNIVNTLGEVLDADRCFLTEYDSSTDKFLMVKDEYVSSDKIEKYAGADANTDVPNFLNEMKKGKYLVIKNKKIFINGKPMEFMEERSAIDKYNVNSAYAIPLFFNKVFIGVLGVHYLSENHLINQNEIELLLMIADQIAMAIHQARLYKETQAYAERETLLRKITSTIRESLDLGETFNVICSEIGKLTNSNRVTITEYVDKYENHVIRGEFKKNHNIDSVSSMNMADRIKVFKYLTAYVFDKKSKPLVINNIDESDVEDYIKQFYKSLDVKSIIIFPIKKGNDVWGILTISHTENYNYWSESEIDFMKAAIEQIYIAINQAELYSNMLQQREREKAILTNLPFMFWLKDIKSRFLAVNEEFAKMCGSSVDGIIGKTDYDFWTKELADSYVKDDKEVMQKRTTKSVEELIIGPNGERWHETYKTPIYNDKNEVVGTTGFARDITESKEAQAELLARQEKIIKSAAREKLLRKIIEKIRVSLDIEEVLAVICEEVAKLFNVKRTIIAYYMGEGEQKKFPMRKEYKSSFDLPVPSNSQDYDKIVEYWSKSVSDAKNILLFDNIETSNAPDFFKEVYSRIGVKSAIGVPIKKEDEIWGSLILYAYDNLRVWTDEEKYLLEAIADQIYIAINQAEIFENEKNVAKKEKALRHIMLYSVGTFNLEEIIHSIVIEAGKLYNADRCFYIEYDYETNSYPPIKEYAQYLSSDTIRSHLESQPSKEATLMFTELVKQKKIITVDDIFRLDLPEATKKMLIDDLSVKSYLISPVYYNDIIYGAIVLHYVNDYKIFSQDDIELAQAIANQSAIVINRAKIYEAQKLAAERERISRNIIEILRSSIDKSIIKKLFVKNLGKFFNADRVFLAEYDAKKNTLMPIDNSSEYLSSASEKTATEYDFTSSEFSQHVEALLEKREIKIENFEEFIKHNSWLDEKMIEHYKQANTKSSYAFPIIYQDKIMGAFAIQFTHKVVKLSEEDIGRIRSICTQAGIALYHANLYEKAKECEVSKKLFISKITEKIEKPVHEIIDISTLLLQNEFEHPIEIEYLNRIVNSCNNLLELTTENDEESSENSDF